MPAKVYRISFSGELAYEVAVESDYGLAMWEAVLAAGQPFDIAPYGTEALGVLRIEKGHVVIGAEIDGRTTPDDLGFGRMVSTKKAFIGQRSLSKPALAAEGRKQLVGLMAADGKTRLRAGAQLVSDPNQPIPMKMEGHVCSVTYSPNLGESIAIALLERGRERMDEEVYALYPLRDEAVKVRVCSAHFIDPDNERVKA